MMLGEEWLKTIAEKALGQAAKSKIHPQYFHCLRPSILEPENGEHVTPDIHWEEHGAGMRTFSEDGTGTKPVFISDEIEKRSPTLLKWAEVYALARALLDNPVTPREDAVFSMNLEKRLSALDRYSIDGNKGGRELNSALYDYLKEAVTVILDESGKCSFSDLKKWLSQNADGTETGIPDCDEVQYDLVDGKPELHWFDSQGKTDRKAVSSLQKTYFKKIKESLR